MSTRLADVLAPVPVPEFLNALRRRELRLVRGTQAATFQPLLDANSLLAALQCASARKSDIRVTRNRQELPRVFYSNETGSIHPDKVSQLLAHGASLVFNLSRSLEAVPGLAHLAEDARRQSGERVSVVAFASTGSGGAFDLHFDSPDVLVMQVEGSKRWRIFGPPVPNPVRGMPQPEKPDERGLLVDEDLQAGDWMLVPAGYWHVCQNGPGLSMHICLSFEPVSVQRALLAIADQLVHEEEAREPVLRSLTLPSGGADVDVLKTRIIERISRFSTEDILALHQTFPGDSY